MVDVGNNREVRKVHLSPLSMVSSKNKYSSSECAATKMKNVPLNPTSSSSSLTKVFLLKRDVFYFSFGFSSVMYWVNNYM